MDENERLFAAIEKLQESVTEVKADIGVLSSQYDESMKKFNRGTEIMDRHASRLRHIEAKLERLSSYFVIIGAVLSACAAGLISLFTGK